MQKRPSPPVWRIVLYCAVLVVAIVVFGRLGASFMA